MRVEAFLSLICIIKCRIIITETSQTRTIVTSVVVSVVVTLIVVVALLSVLIFRIFKKAGRPNGFKAEDEPIS